MFASQLLKILETVPIDAKVEDRIKEDLREEDKTMKENQAEKVHDSANFCEYKEHMIPGHKCLTKVEDSRSSSSESTSRAELDCELPELEVCYKETDHQVVKDICIDEIRPKMDKRLASNGAGRRIFLKSLGDKGEDGEVELELFMSGELDPSLLDDDPWKTGGENVVNTSEDDYPHLAQEYGTRSFLRSFLTTLDGEMKNSVQQPAQDQADNSGKETNNENMELPDNIGWRSNASQVLNRDEGEMSSSAESFITFSGPIPFSGNLSHRSDGSATSGKSFAFPVLRSEWNSSPARMAKGGDGDWRRKLKHKSWKTQLLCCKF
ncbi:uncharacterized protein LOC127245251 isoform X2 [Andrographis paniculata]|uniref:uncharacterized protein LOC127245251 isoform X2 n=1 Tax=Andrographis paniculata TaxID=175694 RepID=UPI0021E79C02|nr:uncharacterized protein LOC127245251 isoform X2 [Andrographis paniculata]